MPKQEPEPDQSIDRRTTMTEYARDGRRRRIPTLGALILCAGLAASPPAPAAEAEQLDQFAYFMGIMQQYYGLLESVHEVAESPQRTTILHLQKMKEIHEDRGDRAAAADALREVITSTTDQTVRNAARMMLVDVLRDTGRASEALQVIDEGIAENAGGR
jgi:hypothetical protein